MNRLVAILPSAALAAALLGPLSVSAAPLDLAAVAADATWVMHLDMDAVRGSAVVRRAWEKAQAMHPHAGGMMDLAAKMTGMDPRKDLRDVTAWGVDTDKRNGVMIVRGKVNRELLEKMAAKAPDHQTMEHRGHALHAWTHRRRGRDGERMVGGFHRDDVLVFGRTPEKVKAALDVLDNAAAAASGDGPLGGRVRPGSILVARAAAVDPDTKCPVLKQGRAFRVAMGETAGTSFYRARLVMESPAAAEAAASTTSSTSSMTSSADAKTPLSATSSALTSASRSSISSPASARASRPFSTSNRLDFSAARAKGRPMDAMTGMAAMPTRAMPTPTATPLVVSFFSNSSRLGRLAMERCSPSKVGKKDQEAFASRGRPRCFCLRRV